MSDERRTLVAELDEQVAKRARKRSERIVAGSLGGGPVTRQVRADPLTGSMGEHNDRTRVATQVPRVPGKPPIWGFFRYVGDIGSEPAADLLPRRERLDRLARPAQHRSSEPPRESWRP